MRANYFVICCAILTVYVVEEMCKCYEVAWQVDPKNEELAAGVFFSYVRVSNFAKQQQVKQGRN